MKNLQNITPSVRNIHFMKRAKSTKILTNALEFVARQVNLKEERLPLAIQKPEFLCNLLHHFKLGGYEI